MLFLALPAQNQYHSSISLTMALLSASGLGFIPLFHHLSCDTLVAILWFWIWLRLTTVFAVSAAVYLQAMRSKTHHRAQVSNFFLPFLFHLTCLVITI
ncbi:hypothetical protein BDV33DRAFT_185000 [Aspergillus novoparasiticus]|uniref:Uncharacterized protein n=1 Tax=Aspergillus novoparasiticus TaxID=986946 RepID=A0A5N6E8A3_9EURO|nr:hypothetical protein BDV33DRAFT_185000 [Aspergillus novoparasiticus]